jgi:hypothetical protein
MRLPALLVPKRAALIVHKHALISSLLIAAGCAGLLGFASLVGLWLVGLAGMAESAGLLYFGLFRDDGKPVPARGLLSHEEILARERARPWEPS